MLFDRKKFLIDWIIALRSGNYQQGTGGLRTDNTYCCLGVGCEVYDTASWVKHDDGIYSYKGGILFFPKFLKDLTGISPDQEKKLIEMNDDGKTFVEIADHIEQEILNAKT